MLTDSSEAGATLISSLSLFRYCVSMRITQTLPPLSVNLSAPGVDILSSVPGDSYQTFSGTSMAEPMYSGLSTLLMARATGTEVSHDQVAGALRHGDAKEILTGKADFRTSEEYLVLDAKDLLRRAGEEGNSVKAELDRRFPVQDEMPIGFRDDSERDKYFQDRLDRRAEVVEALRTLESEPGHAGPKTDWSGEQSVSLDELDPPAKAAFYAKLDTLNQAYYGKVIALLGH